MAAVVLPDRKLAQSQTVSEERDRVVEVIHRQHQSHFV
jgi:hypothetical protein